MFAPHAQCTRNWKSQRGDQWAAMNTFLEERIIVTKREQSLFMMNDKVLTFTFGMLAYPGYTTCFNRLIISYI
jgi:hypothetical protein